MGLTFGSKGIFGPMGSIKGSPAIVKVGKNGLVGGLGRLERPIEISKDGALLSLLIRLPSAAFARQHQIAIKLTQIKAAQI